jgi:hypothetical protein
MQTGGWPSIRELDEGDRAMLAGLDEPVCGWAGCDNEARWEVVYEDLQDMEDLARSEPGLKVESAGKSQPFSELVATQTFLAYCDEHARRVCLENRIEPPTNLSM